MPEITVRNWFGDLISHPKIVTEAHSADDLVRILTDPVQFPSPVRAVGSNHSTSPCGVAEGGTLVKMKMNRILHIGTDTLTAEAGALYIDLAKELERRGLQFHVNTEIGCLSAGSAACAGTKDGSMYGEYGQVGSYVIGVKMVLPNGQLLEVTEAEQPELMKEVRSSHGTFGIIYEVTFCIRPLTPMKVFHRTFNVEEFADRIPELRKLNTSMMMYLFPLSNKVTVEFREYNPGANGKPNRRAWAMRNRLWAVSGPFIGDAVERFIYPASLRYAILDCLNGAWRFILEHRVRGDYMIPPDQIIRYPPVGGRSRYTFSMFAFPEIEYPKVLLEFFNFCTDYYRQKRYRINLLCVGYTIAQDQQALLSYSYDGPVMSIDPVSTANPGWREFLEEFNQFCSDRNGAPLLNQTWGLTPTIVQKAFGDRLKLVAATRKKFDPDGRLLNDYFAKLFA
ncbi:MAG TPA: FAD-dependent oxidoreductase [Terriglobales bacterium]|nr:FAD-dependent oxidoreductase [Terriglobales bacterium]